MLKKAQLEEFQGLAGELGMAALVEVHGEKELRTAVDIGAKIIGVNNRDLTTFKVTLEVSESLSGKFPDGTIKVSESGILGSAHVMRVAKAGYDAVLVGEHLMRQNDVAEATRKLMGRD